MAAAKVTSEIFAENCLAETEIIEGKNAVSKFFFKYPPHMRKSRLGNGDLEYDDDGDLILDRNEERTILIEHSVSTELKLVGLQIWRGALLLADYILSNPEIFENKTILELGSGVGFDSIVAGMVAKDVICTDIDLGDILKLIEKNLERNKALIRSSVWVTELDFLDLNWNEALERRIEDVDVIMAADVIYDDKITEGFVATLAKLLTTTTNRDKKGDGQPAPPPARQRRCAYVAMEKRYVFTLAELDSVAPMYEEFLRCLRRSGHEDWSVEEIGLGDLPQYFRYQRLSQLVLLRIARRDG